MWLRYLAYDEAKIAHWYLFHHELMLISLLAVPRSSTESQRLNENQSEISKNKNLSRIDQQKV